MDTFSIYFKNAMDNCSIRKCTTLLIIYMFLLTFNSVNQSSIMDKNYFC